MRVDGKSRDDMDDGGGRVVCVGVCRVFDVWHALQGQQAWCGGSRSAGAGAWDADAASDTQSAVSMCGC